MKPSHVAILTGLRHFGILARLPFELVLIVVSPLSWRSPAN